MSFQDKFIASIMKTEHSPTSKSKNDPELSMSDGCSKNSTPCRKRLKLPSTDSSTKKCTPRHRANVLNRPKTSRRTSRRKKMHLNVKLGDILNETVRKAKSEKVRKAMEKERCVDDVETKHSNDNLDGTTECIDGTVLVKDKEIDTRGIPINNLNKNAEEELHCLHNENNDNNFVKTDATKTETEEKKKTLVKKALSPNRSLSTSERTPKTKRQAAVEPGTSAESTAVKKKCTPRKSENATERGSTNKKSRKEESRITPVSSRHPSALPTPSKGQKDFDLDSVAGIEHLKMVTEQLSLLNDNAHHINTEIHSSKITSKKLTSTPVVDIESVNNRTPTVSPVKRQEQDNDSDWVSDDDDESTLKIVEPDHEFDGIIDKKASSHKMTATNVKSLIHSVLTDDTVVSMMKCKLKELSGEEAELSKENEINDVKYQPKLTRSKLREITIDGKCPPQAWPLAPWALSPIKPEATKKVTLMDLQFSEDEDEEYVPGSNPAEDLSDDDSSIVSSSRTSDMGSPFPRSPRTPCTPNAPFSPCSLTSQEKMGNTTPRCRTPSMTESPMPPPRVKTPMRKRLLIDGEPDGTIAKRTRSKLPLTDTPLDVIESSYVAPDFTYDMYDMDVEMDTDYVTFLQELIQEKHANDTMDDEMNDPEYNFLAEEEVLEPDEMRHDKSVKVTKRELNELLDEVFDLFADEDFVQNDVPSISVYSPQKVILLNSACVKDDMLEDNLQTIRRDSTLEELQDFETGVQNRVQNSFMTSEQRAQFDQQMRQHVQLLLQHHVLADEESGQVALNDQCTYYLNELQTLAQHSQIPLSAFQASNLNQAVYIVDNFYGFKILEVPALEKWHKKFRISRHKTINPKCLTGYQMLWFVKCEALHYPDLMPLCNFLSVAEVNVTKAKRYFLKGEDNLVALAIEQLTVNGKCRKLYELISQYWAPYRHAFEIRKRVKYLKNLGPSFSAIAHFKEFGRLPEFDRTVIPFNVQNPPKPTDFKMKMLPHWCVELETRLKTFKESAMKALLKNKRRRIARLKPKPKRLSPARLSPVVFPRSQEFEISKNFAPIMPKQKYSVPFSQNMLLMEQLLGSRQDVLNRIANFNGVVPRSQVCYAATTNNISQRKAQKRKREVAAPALNLEEVSTPSADMQSTVNLVENVSAQTSDDIPVKSPTPPLKRQKKTAKESSKNDTKKKTAKKTSPQKNTKKSKSSPKNETTDSKSKGKTPMKGKKLVKSSENKKNNMEAHMPTTSVASSWPTIQPVTQIVTSTLPDGFIKLDPTSLPLLQSTSIVSTPLSFGAPLTSDAVFVNPSGSISSNMLITSPMKITLGNSTLVSVPIICKINDNSQSDMSLQPVENVACTNPIGAHLLSGLASDSMHSNNNNPNVQSSLNPKVQDVTENEHEVSETLSQSVEAVGEAESLPEGIRVSGNVTPTKQVIKPTNSNLAAVYSFSPTSGLGVEPIASIQAIPIGDGYNVALYPTPTRITTGLVEEAEFENKFLKTPSPETKILKTPSPDKPSAEGGKRRYRRTVDVPRNEPKNASRKEWSILPKAIILSAQSPSPTKRAADRIKIRNKKQHLQKLRPILPNITPAVVSIMTRSRSRNEDEISQNLNVENEIHDGLASQDDDSNDSLPNWKNIITDISDSGLSIPAPATDDTDHLAELMFAASTTVARTKKKPLSKQALLDRKRDEMDAILKPNIDSDPLREECEQVLLDNYIERVRECYGNSPNTIESFLEVLDGQRNVIELYSTVKELFKSEPSLIEDFAMFLTPEQAVECGCLIQCEQFNASRVFMRKLEIYFKKQPSVYQKIMRALSSRGTGDTSQIISVVKTLLKNQPLLLDEFSQFIGDEAPPATFMTDFEDVYLMGDSDENENGLESPDSVEDSRLSDDTLCYGTSKCECRCHDDQKDSSRFKRKTHCRNCALRVIDNKLCYVGLRKNSIQPVKIITHNKDTGKAILPPQRLKKPIPKKKAKSNKSKKRTGAVAEAAAKAEDEDEEEAVNIDQQKIDSAGASFENSEEEDEDLDNSGEIKMEKSHEDYLMNKETEITDVLVAKDNASDVNDAKEEIDKINENFSENTQCDTTVGASEISEHKSEEISTKINPSDNVTKSATDASFSLVSETESNPPLEFENKLLSWRLDEDKLILESTSGFEDYSAFMRLADKLPGRSAEEIKKRFGDLLELMGTDESENDFSESDAE